jgi:twinkle protein
VSLPIELPEALGVRVEALYKSGLPPGDSTGWVGLDPFYTVGPRQSTLITGVPGMGKSEFLDALMVNLAMKTDWFFAVYSPENQPTETHVAKIAEKYVGKPFGDGPNDRMTKIDLTDAMGWIDDHFIWMLPEGKTVFDILDAALFFRPKDRKFGVVLDPWNQLVHVRPDQRMSETDYIGEMLTYTSHWCRKNDVHLFIVAHPQKLAKDGAGKRPIPTPYDIHGSAHWFNKGDNILCVNRDMGGASAEVQIHVQKVRFKNIGRAGDMATLHYDRLTGRYRDAASPAPPEVPW